MIPEPIDESPEKANPDMLSSNGKIIDGIIADLRTTIDQLAIDFNTAKSLILELARRFDEIKRCEQCQICRRIKEILQDKIKGGKITEKWIEECLPQEYKRRYTKSEVSSLSKRAKGNAAEQQRKNKDTIVVDAQSGKSVLTNVDGHNDDDDDSDFDTHDNLEQGQNKEYSDQNTGSEDNDERQALRSEIYELRQAVKRLTFMQTADKISTTELEFTIPKEKYEDVKAAMESSRGSISVTFDKSSGMLQRAEPDI